MTLNITKKKIEKVLELFNHPQTRKIRKNRGKKRRRNIKSFNRKNGRKNLATSTLKKRGGQSNLNGGFGPVIGGQVGGTGVNIDKLASEAKEIQSILDDIKKDINDNTNFANIKENILKHEKLDDTNFKTMINDITVDEYKKYENNKQYEGDPPDDNKYRIIAEILKEKNNKKEKETGQEEGEREGEEKEKEKGEGEKGQEDITENFLTNLVKKNKNKNQANKTITITKVESKNDKMMKLLTLREDYTIFNILNNLLPPKEEGQTADLNLKEIVKKLDFGKFVDEIGILKNDEEEDGDGKGEEVVDGEVDNNNKREVVEEQRQREGE